MKADFLATLTGSFSQPAGENPTVAMIEAAYQQQQLNWRYINCEVAPANLADAVRGARAMNWAGFNCSIPHKIAIIEHLDGLGESAAIMGAVNTVVRRGQQLIGENTDGKGFLQSLQTITNPTGLSVLILGAGGAARAIAVELALAGARHITIANRSAASGQTLVELINQQTPAQADFLLWNHPLEISADLDLLVNATSIGLYPDINALPNIQPETLHRHTIVADVIPNPPQTRLLQIAAQQGCQTLNGIGMLVNQGKLAIQLWSGQTVDSVVMQHTLQAIFGEA
jgi:shikimate dehydrogenase